MTSADALAAILARAEAAGWAGPDPYDGLASSLAGTLIPLGALPRFAFSQIVLRVPLARTLAQPRPTVNAKALGLLIGAAVRGREDLGMERARSICASLRTDLEGLANRSGEALGWGYPFPWQSRSFWAPAGTPNAVVTATVGWHMLDLADAIGDERARSLGRSAADFLASALNESRVEEGSAISYTRADRTRVINISALAARVIARAADRRPEAGRDDLAERLVRFVLGEQREDGSWPYSADPGGGWEDSFHTGYVLEALLSVRELGIPVSDDALARGFSAYGRFFDPDGGARLYASSSSPFDAHSAAQGIITFAALDSSSVRAVPAWPGARETTMRIATWAKEALWLPRGYFAYRIHRGRRDEREFIRWVQAWMALAMATAASLEPKVAISNAPVDAVGVA